MRAHGLSVLALGAALGGWALQGGPEELVSVERVVDGDTVRARRSRDNALIKVRLQGIDAPETRQEGGPEARAVLAALLTGTGYAEGSGPLQVWLRQHGRDKYERTLGTLYVARERVPDLPWLDANREMVRLGYAWHYRQYSSDAALEAAERDARASRRGIFAGGEPQPPWEWRRAHRSKKHT